MITPDGLRACGQIVVWFTILTGVMESLALRTSPGYDEFLKQARMRNPHRRLTMPEDVARCIAALCHPATCWMTGNTLHVGWRRERRKDKAWPNFPASTCLKLRRRFCAV